MTLSKNADSIRENLIKMVEYVSLKGNVSFNEAKVSLFEKKVGFFYFDLVALLILIEKLYKIEITLDDLNKYRLDNIDNIVVFIQSKYK